MGLLNALVSLIAGATPPLVETAETVCQMLQSFNSDSANLSPQYREILDNLCATCRAFSAEKNSLSKDADYLGAFLQQMLKAIDMAEKSSEVDPKIKMALGPLKRLVQMHMEKLGIAPENGNKRAYPFEGAARTRGRRVHKRRRPTRSGRRSSRKRPRH